MTWKRRLLFGSFYLKWIKSNLKMQLAYKFSGSKNPEDLCCRNGMGKFAALILGCGTIFGIFLLAFGLLWFKMKRYCLHRKLNQPS